MNQTICRVSAFTAGEKRGLDKNNNQGVYLNYVSGAALPQRARVLSGTIAKSGGFEIGKTYIVNWQETWVDETYGQQYTHSVVSETSGSDLLGLFASRLSEVQNLTFTRKIKPAESEEVSSASQAAPAATVNAGVEGEGEE